MDANATPMIQILIWWSFECVGLERHRTSAWNIIGAGGNNVSAKPISRSNAFAKSAQHKPFRSDDATCGRIRNVCVQWRVRNALECTSRESVHAIHRADLCASCDWMTYGWAKNAAQRHANALATDKHAGKSTIVDCAPALCPNKQVSNTLPGTNVNS